MFKNNSSRGSRAGGSRRFGSSKNHSQGSNFGNNRSQGGASRQFGRRAGGQFSRRPGRQPKTVDVRLLVNRASSEIPFEPVSTATFADFALAPWLQENVAARGYLTPTPIQEQVIPHLLMGRDVVGIANTGTGKTAAFLLPILHKLSQDREGRVLIIAPTRELAAQIREEVIEFTPNTPLTSTLCIGGVNLGRQAAALRRRPDIVIGTPGRLRDLNNQNLLKFDQFNTVVLDEVDRMLDMGFITDVRHILSLMPKARQSLFFSATLSDAVKTIMNTFLHQPVIISVKSQETAVNVDQDVVRLAGRDKMTVLEELLAQEGFEKVIIFGRTKRGVEKLSAQLNQRGYGVVALHGNKTQNQRLRALHYFKNNQASIMLATDVAARGLDIDDVTHVINFDLPETYEDYIHRIGRTGRSGKTGVALSLV